MRLVLPMDPHILTLMGIVCRTFGLSRLNRSPSYKQKVFMQWKDTSSQLGRLCILLTQEVNKSPRHIKQGEDQAFNIGSQLDTACSNVFLDAPKLEMLDNLM